MTNGYKNLAIKATVHRALKAEACIRGISLAELIGQLLQQLQRKPKDYSSL